MQRALSSDLVAGGASHRLLIQILHDVESNYLERWVAALAQANHGLHPERAARALAGHLLDTGASQQYLHRWLTWLSDHDGNEHDASSVAREAERLIARRLRRYHVLVLLETAYPPSVVRPDELLDRDDAAAWLERWGLTRLVSNADYEQGLLLRLRAHDPESAAEQAGEIVDALVARAAVGTRNRLIVRREVAVRSVTDQLFPLRRRRRVDVRALERQDRLADDLYALQNGPVDAALQLLSHLDTSSPEVAVAAGWSAVESLLTAPGDKGGNVLAAHRLAALVACAWPRAELTTLAYKRVAAHDDGLAAEIDGAATNRDKAEIVAREIKAGAWLKLQDPSDETAERRMTKLFQDPKRTLEDVAHLIDGRDPLNLAARAELELKRAGSRDASPLTRLLES